MCKAFAFLHDKCKIIHTDLKPENVLVKHSGELPDIKQATKMVAAPPEPPSANRKNTGKQTGAKSAKVAGATNVQINQVQALNIEKVQALLEKREMDPAERKKLKKKLKRIKQRAKANVEPRNHGTHGQI